MQARPSLALFRGRCSTLEVAVVATALGVAGITLGLVSEAAGARPRCNATPRAAVETLRDRAARRVDFRARWTTVSALREQRPSHAATRSGSVEFSAFRLRARLVRARLASNGDVDVVVADPDARARTMIVVFPSPSCTRNAVQRWRMAVARATFLASCGLPPAGNFGRMWGVAIFTGVGFFDPGAVQPPAAPNAVQLHPVLRFRPGGCGGLSR